MEGSAPSLEFFSLIFGLEVRILVHSPAPVVNVQPRFKYFKQKTVIFLLILVDLSELWACGCSPVHPGFIRP